jgi:hypothetical protein
MDAKTERNAHMQAAAMHGSLQGLMQHKAAKQYTGCCQPKTSRYTIKQYKQLSITRFYPNQAGGRW